MSEIVYSTLATPLAEGRTFRNPRFFSGPEAGVERVHIVGDWPVIAEAYRAAGVEVVQDGVEAPQPAPEPDEGEFGPLANEFVESLVPVLAERVPVAAFIAGKGRRRK